MRMWIVPLIITISLICGVLNNPYTPMGEVFKLTHAIQHYTQEEKACINVYKKAAPFSVAIRVKVEDGVSSGAGAIITPDGVVLTAAHVIKDAQLIAVRTNDDNKYKATLIKDFTKEGYDLALLKLDSEKKDFIYGQLINFNELEIGQNALAIGYPLLPNELSIGHISQFDRILHAIIIDTSVNPGNSGGPLLNSNGDIIGVVDAMYTNHNANEGINIALGVNAIIQWLKERMVK